MESTTQPPVQTQRSLGKRLLRWFFFSLLAVVLTLGTAVLLVVVYQDEIKGAVITELNAHLKAEIEVDPANIDLTVVSTFPDCALRFKKVLMREALPIKKRDTLLYTEELSLSFSLRDIWEKNYRIHAVTISDAIAKPAILKDGRDNYTFWSTTTTTSTASPDSVSFDIESLTLKNIRLWYRDKQAGIAVTTRIKELVFTGAFRTDQYTLQTKGELFLENIRSRETTYIKNQTLTCDLALDVNKDKYTFSKASLHISDLALDLGGHFIYGDSLTHLETTFNAPHLDVVQVISLLPENYRKYTNDYESSGTFFLKGNLQYQPSQGFSVMSDFGVSDGSITYKARSGTADHINLNGKFEWRNNRSVVEIKHYTFALSGDKVQGSFILSDFNDPYLRLTTKANVNLENVFNLSPIDTITLLKGRIDLATEIEGRLNDLQKQTFSDKVRLQMHANINQLQLQFKNDDKVTAVEQCELLVAGRSAEVKDMVLKRGASDVKVSGRLPGLFNYLTDSKAPLVIEGRLLSNHISLEDFMFASSSGSTSTDDSPLIAEGIDFTLQAEINDLTYAQFAATNIRGLMEVRNRKAMVSDMHLQTMNGVAEIDALADNSKDKLVVTLQSKLENIELSELYRQMNNFGQATLTDKNISGLTTATVVMTGIWNNNLEVDLKSIKSVIDLQVDRGRLKDFSPLMSLSKFVDIKALQDISFATLWSQISIENEIIYIPRTSINNSALNIEFNGQHKFNYDIDYHIRLFLSEYFAKKMKKEDEFGPVENDPDNRRSAFILMTGNMDNPVIKYDLKGMKQKIKEDLKKEGTTIRNIIRQERGLLDMDTVKSGKKNQRFILEEEKPVKKKKQEVEEPADDDFWGVTEYTFELWMLNCE